MLTETDLLSIIDAYASALNLEDSSASWRIFGDNKRVPALRSGATITVRRMNETLRFLSSNWPRGAKWPKGVYRPRKTVAGAQ